MISFHFSRSIIRPLSNLQNAAGEISRGNLDYEIAEEGDGEIQALCRKLEAMRIKLKESIHTQLKYEENRKMLISSISHDLKTPVTSIKGYVEGIFDGIANTPEKMDKYLKTIYVKAGQVDTMIDDLLLYAKLDLNQIPFQFEPTDIEKYIRECILEFEPELERRQIRISLQSGLGQSHVLPLDRERMRRVLMNILDNSCKYMDKEKGEIKILLRETYTGIIIELRDNGAGIGPQDLPYIFDRFYRSDSARSQGSGLGLAIAKQIVEGHNGRVWAVSNAGGGTSILISLGTGSPAAEEKDGKGRKMNRSKEKSTSLNQEAKKILIVEDDPSIAELQKDYLEVAGFAVKICADGLAGFQEIQKESYDLLIIDIMLPGLDGLEILRRMNEEKDIPVLLVSAKKEEIDKIKGFSLGADDYITKPFSPGELVARVKAHLENYERLKNRFKEGPPPVKAISIRGLRIEKGARRVYVHGQEVNLAQKEFDLLLF